MANHYRDLPADSLKSMIRTIDNRIAYRQKQIEDNQELIANWERQREKLAEALDAADDGDVE